jgi:hypothetical protein
MNNNEVCKEYWDKIVSECDLALEGVGKLNFSVMTLYRNRGGQAQYRQFQEEVFLAIGGFLTSAGNISCLLWPDKVGRHQEKTGQVNIMSLTGDMQAAKCLRRCLRIDKRHILYKRWLKNSFAEKMGVSNQLHHQDRAFHIVGSYLPFSGHFMSEMAFLYDPLSRKIQYGEETLDIQEIATAIHNIKNSLQEEYWKTRKESASVMVRANMRTAA